MIHEEFGRIAALPTAKAMVDVPRGRDVERMGLFEVEGAGGNEVRAAAAQGEKVLDDSFDAGSFEDEARGSGRNHVVRIGRAGLQN